MAQQEHERKREERLRNLKLMKQEEGAKNGFKMMMKRKAIYDEANRQLEERRNNILEHQADIEHRLMMHEMKKERYLEFKAELDGLKEKNKEINVIRQRRKEDQRREDWAEAVRRKDDKIEMLHHERQFLWGMRRTTGQEIQNAREEVKNMITSMKLKSKYSAKAVEDKLQKVFRKKIFNTDYNTVQSMPSLKFATTQELEMLENTAGAPAPAVTEGAHNAPAPTETTKLPPIEGEHSAPPAEVGSAEYTD